MSLFGGNTKNQPTEDLKPLGIEPRRASTNEQARPVPYLAGRQRVALTWLCDVFNVVATPIVQKIGKKKTTVGYSYSCSFAGLICGAQLDAIRKIWFDGEEVWSGAVTRSGDSTTITIPTRGDLTLYWGTETQTADAHLATSGQNHPPYRGQPYIVFESLQLGQNRTQVPNVEVLVERYPDPSWMTAAANIEDDANLIAVIAELLQSARFGLALPDSRLNTTLLNTIAAQLETEELGISPLITRQSTARQLVAEAFEYVDGFLTTGNDGKIGAALVRPIPDPGVLPEIDANDMTEEADIDPGTWVDTENETWVVFTSRDREYMEDALPYHDAGNFAITLTHKPQTLQRPWCTRPLMAQRIAQATGKAAAIPQIRGTLQLRHSSAIELEIGDPFRLSYAPWAMTNLVARVQSRGIASPARPVIRIDWQVDRGSSNAQQFEPDIDDPPEPPVFDPVVNSFERVMEAPLGVPAMATEEEILLLAARGNGVVIGFNVHRKQPSGTFDQIADRDRFAVHGELDVDYEETTIIDDEVGFLVQLDAFDTEFENRDFEDCLTGAVLVFIGGEIMWPFGAVLEGPDLWRIFAVRARYDSLREHHASSDPVWIVSRALLPVVTAEPAFAVQRYKLQPFSINRVVDLATCTEQSVNTVHRSRRPLRPLNLAEGGEFAAPFYTTGEDLELTWTITMEERGPFFSLWGGGITENLPKTVLEFLTTGDVLERTEELDPGVDSFTYDNADLVADFGSEVDIKIRAYHKRNSYLSTYFTEITVQKV